MKKKKRKKNISLDFLNLNLQPQGYQTKIKVQGEKDQLPA